MPKFTTQHYEVVARAFHSVLSQGVSEDSTGIWALMEELISEFRKDNPGFKPDAFLSAVMKDEEVA